MRIISYERTETDANTWRPSVKKRNENKSYGNLKPHRDLLIFVCVPRHYFITAAFRRQRHDDFGLSVPPYVPKPEILSFRTYMGQAVGPSDQPRPFYGQSVCPERFLGISRKMHGGMVCYLACCLVPTKGIQSTPKGHHFRSRGHHFRSEKNPWKLEFLQLA